MNLNGSTSRLARPDASPGGGGVLPAEDRTLSQQIRASPTPPSSRVSLSQQSLVMPLLPFPPRPQDALLLALRRVRRTRVTRIMLPFFARLSVAVDYFPSANTRLNDLSGSVNQLLLASFVGNRYASRITPYGQLTWRVFASALSQRNINTLGNGTSQTVGGRIGAESRISPFDRTRYLSLGNHIYGSRRPACRTLATFTQYFFLTFVYGATRRKREKRSQCSIFFYRKIYSSIASLSISLLRKNI